MPLQLSDFWTWQGRVGRAKYVAIGVGLFAIKHNLDRVIATLQGYDWSVFNYWLFSNANGIDDVRNQPPVMNEWSPYKDLHPPHLENYLSSRKGQFLLTQLPDGTTRIEGTTWYQNRFWPAAYWHQWSDYIIHRIHMRVLLHIKNLSETK